MFGTQRNNRCRDRRSLRPRLEALEGRQLLTTINFDNLPAMVPGPGTIPVEDRLSNQLDNQGVIFSTGLGAGYVPVVGPSDGTSPPNSIWRDAWHPTLGMYSRQCSVLY